MSGRVTDVHVHIHPSERVKPEVASLLRRHDRAGADPDALSRDPEALLRIMDEAGVWRMVLVNYESPDVIGHDRTTNDWVLRYCRAAPERLLPCVGINPRFQREVRREARRLVDGGARMFKIHGPHMLIRANAYLDEHPSLAGLYEVAQETKVPVMFHTGSSIFPGARTRYGDPLQLDDVGIDFPDLEVILAHGGRPLWTEAAWFLLRRFERFWFDISSIPPSRLLAWFPRLEEISDRVLFGTDWPGPGVPPVGENLAAVRALDLSPEAIERIVSANALRLLP